MSSFLNKVRVNTIERLKLELTSLNEMQVLAKKARVPHDFSKIFNKNAANIIAEIKFASPSRGELNPLKDSVAIARGYLANGASAISVLTEPNYFSGSLDYLYQIRQAFPDALLLMKDFIIHEYQLLQARIYGADAVLFIAAMLSYDQLKSLYKYALELGLTPLVEVHTVNELRNIIAFSSKKILIGINNRDLNTLEINLETSRQLIEYKNSNSIFIAESGIDNAKDILNLRSLGYEGFLIGSHFMKNSNPGLALKKLLQEVSDAR